MQDCVLLVACYKSTLCSADTQWHDALEIYFISYKDPAAYCVVWVAHYVCTSAMGIDPTQVERGQQILSLTQFYKII